MAKESSLGVKLAQFLEIPMDTAVVWPKIVMNANRNIIIQNHRGVIEYDQNLVRINTKLGEIKISGKNLALLSALKDEIVVEGRIDQVELIDWR